jgi:predicted HD superfamily hydrolase involved in NAD metabolism
VSGDGLQFVRLARRVRADLGQRHRWIHTLGVSRTAAHLATLHGEDARKARLAGLLHDLARLWSNERLLAECALRNMPIDAFEQAHPIVLHARLGAERARKEYRIDDPAILSAIARHTVAAADMSRLDTILYVADALEPGRNFSERAFLLARAERDLEDGMRGVLESTVSYLNGRGLTVAPQTLAAIRQLTSGVARENFPA